MKPGLLHAFAADIRSSALRRDWYSSVLRHIPGETGFSLRARFFRKRMRAAGDGLRIFPGARIHGAANLSVGKNCRIGYDNIIQANGEIEIGDEVLLAPYVLIWSINHVFAKLDIPIWDQGYDHKKVVIGNGVWIGANSFIMPGAILGDHVVVSAGSVVGGKAIEPYSIIAGNPARKVGSRLDRADVPQIGGPTV